MELITSPPPATRDALPTMGTPMLPPSTSSAMNAAAAARTRAVAAKFRDSGARHFPSPSPLPSPSLSPPPQESLVRQMVVALMHPPLILSTLPPLPNAHQGSVASCPLEPLFPFASRSLASCCVACCRAPLPRVTFCCAAASRVHP